MPGAAASAAAGGRRCSGTNSYSIAGVMMKVTRIADAPSTPAEAARSYARHCAVFCSSCAGYGGSCWLNDLVSSRERRKERKALKGRGSAKARRGGPCSLAQSRRVPTERIGDAVRMFDGSSSVYNMSSASQQTTTGASRLTPALAFVSGFCMSGQCFALAHIGKPNEMGTLHSY